MKQNFKYGGMEGYGISQIKDFKGKKNIMRLVKATLCRWFNKSQADHITRCGMDK